MPVMCELYQVVPSGTWCVPMRKGMLAAGLQSTAAQM